MTGGFEGSYLGSGTKISPQAIMECKICWTPYDPADGDDYRQVEPGTPFLDLPDDWHCPNCDAPKEQFMVLEDPGSDVAAATADLSAKTKALVADFTEIFHAKMRDVPLCNLSLHVQAVGFRLQDGRGLGVLVAPWFMNLVQLPGKGEDWSALTPGAKEVLTFPSGSYEFIHNTRETVGGYKACSLFSPMGDFNSQAQAVDVASAVMSALFNPENQAETDRSADIRQAREDDLAAAEAAKAEAEAQKIGTEPTRRRLITGGLGGQDAPQTTAAE